MSGMNYTVRSSSNIVTIHISADWPMVDLDANFRQVTLKRILATDT